MNKSSSAQKTATTAGYLHFKHNKFYFLPSPCYSRDRTEPLEEKKRKGHYKGKTLKNTGHCTRFECSKICESLTIKCCLFVFNSGLGKIQNLMAGSILIHECEFEWKFELD